MITGAIIQARLGSARLPRKVLMEIPPGSRVTVLERVVDSVRKSKLVEDVVVATLDAEVASFCDEQMIRWSQWQGPRDPLSEFYSVAKMFGFDPVVRITADCPLIRTEVIDMVVGVHLGGDAPYTYNHCDDTGGKGDGQDVEVFSLDILEAASIHATDPRDREHVTPWIRANANVQKVPAPDFESRSLNTPEDYEAIWRLIEKEKG